MPLVDASDESIHALKTANINLFKINNRNTERYEIWSINKDTKTTVCYYHFTIQSESTRYSSIFTPECLLTPCSKQTPYVNLKWLQGD